MVSALLVLHVCLPGDCTCTYQGIAVVEVARGTAVAEVDRGTAVVEVDRGTAGEPREVLWGPVGWLGPVGVGPAEVGVVREEVWPGEEVAWQEAGAADLYERGKGASSIIHVYMCMSIHSRQLRSHALAHDHCCCMSTHSRQRRSHDHCMSTHSRPRRSHALAHDHCMSTHPPGGCWYCGWLGGGTDGWLAIVF